MQTPSANVISSGRRAAARLYWLFPALLLGLQAVYTFRSTHQILYEELMESVRNVYLLQHRVVFNGTSSNIGWYGILLLVYNTLGFGLHTATFVRLAIDVASILCLAALLRKWMGARRALVPLVTMGLSPVFLYFNTLQAQYGLDLQLFPICLYLLERLRLEGRSAAVVTQAALWGLAMVACMSYPVFVLYLPVLGILYLRKVGRGLKERGVGTAALDLLVSAVAFIAPLVAGFLYVRNRDLLVYDPATGTGLFRGGGPLHPDPAIFIRSLKVAFGELVVRGNGYHFDLSLTELQGAAGIVPAVFVAGAGLVLLFTARRLRLALSLSWLLIALNIILPGLSESVPGIRRGTGMLAGLYALYAIVWYHLTGPEPPRPALKWAGVVICLLLPAHHLVAYAKNLSSLARPSIYRVTAWYNVRSTPAESLDFWLKHTEKDGVIVLPGGPGTPANRFSEIYYALAGYRHWNGLGDEPIVVHDARSGGLIRLSPPGVRGRRAPASTSRSSGG